MAYNPEDLQEVVKAMPTNLSWPSVHLARAFLTVATTIEKNLAFRTSTKSMTWLQGVSEVAVWIEHVQMVKNSGGSMPRQKFEVLLELALDSWRVPSKGPRRQLDFIRDAALREIAERDLGSLSNARAIGETKMALVLAGSVVEAVLWDILEESPEKARVAAARAHAALKFSNFKVDNAEQWKFYQVVGICGPEGVGALSVMAVKCANTCREWRNFVHPKLERVEVGEPLRESQSQIAEALVAAVLEDVASWRSKGSVFAS